MELKDCFHLGTINRIIGFSGEVSVTIDADHPEDYNKLESVFIELNEKLVPFFITSIAIDASGKAVIKFEDVNSQDEAKFLLGNSLYLPLSFLPKLSGNKFYYHEVIGFKIMDAKLGEIGPVNDIVETYMQSVIKTEYKENEVLIPIADPFIKFVDREKKEILVDLPDGLIDVYMKS